MSCLYAKCTPIITSCVMAELEKLGQKLYVRIMRSHTLETSRSEADPHTPAASPCELPETNAGSG